MHIIITVFNPASRICDGVYKHYISRLKHTYVQSLSRVNDAVDRINSKADREFFIKTKGTGTTRPVDRVFD